MLRLAGVLAALALVAPVAAADAVAVNPTGDARGDLVAVSGTGSASAGRVAVSGTGHSTGENRCDLEWYEDCHGAPTSGLVVSGAGNAAGGPSDTAVSPLGTARCWAWCDTAASGGDAGHSSQAVSVWGDAEGWRVVSVLGGAHSLPRHWNESHAPWLWSASVGGSASCAGGGCVSISVAADAYCAGDLSAGGCVAVSAAGDASCDGDGCFAVDRDVLDGVLP